MDPIPGASAGQAAPKGKRFLAGLFDLVVIPIILGIVIGFLLLNAGEAIRNVILVLFNIGWLVFRDYVFSPGRALVGLKLVSLSGGKVTVVQALLRNILLIIPVVLLVGYIVEIISVLSRNQRLADQWAKTRVVTA